RTCPTSDPSFRRCEAACILVLNWRLKMGSFRSISGFVMLLSTCAPLPAQWLHYPSPGIPRTPDGKPNLSAAAPKTTDGKPDLSGVWVSPGTKYFFDLTADGVEAPMLPRAAALYKERLGQLQK